MSATLVGGGRGVKRRREKRVQLEEGGREKVSCLEFREKKMVEEKEKGEKVFL